MSTPLGCCLVVETINGTAVRWRVYDQVKSASASALSIFGAEIGSEQSAPYVVVEGSSGERE
jgi:hypothetical protein